MARAWRPRSFRQETPPAGAGRLRSASTGPNGAPMTRTSVPGLSRPPWPRGARRVGSSGPGTVRVRQGRESRSASRIVQCISAAGLNGWSGHQSRFVLRRCRREAARRSISGGGWRGLCEGPFTHRWNGPSSAAKRRGGVRRTKTALAVSGSRQPGHLLLLQPRRLYRDFS